MLKAFFLKDSTFASNIFNKTQVIGRKRVLLWPPEQTPYLYPHQEKHEFKKQSQVDFSSPDLVKFPNFISASAIEVILLLN
jgi:histone arginine demethylase JMJD6